MVSNNVYMCLPRTACIFNHISYEKRGKCFSLCFPRRPCVLNPLVDVRVQKLHVRSPVWSFITGESHKTTSYNNGSVKSFSNLRPQFCPDNKRGVIWPFTTYCYYFLFHPSPLRSKIRGKLLVRFLFQKNFPILSPRSEDRECNNVAACTYVSGRSSMSVRLASVIVADGINYAFVPIGGNVSECSSAIMIDEER